MNKLLWVISPILLLLTQLSAETLTVDNNPGSVAMYSSLITAINEASAGDTLLIAGSASPYGGVFNLYKQLHFVGPGYLLGANGIPGLNSNVAQFHIEFKKDNSLGDSSGSSYTGMQGQFNSAAGVTGIVIDKCDQAAWNWNFQGQVTVKRSYGGNSVTLGATNSSISNCIVGAIHLNQPTSAATNCVVRSSISTVPSSSVSNTIFLNTSGFSFGSSPTFCLAIGSSPLPDNGNNINGKLLGEVLVAAQRVCKLEFI
jgi:hypothetical protein